MAVQHPPIESPGSGSAPVGSSPSFTRWIQPTPYDGTPASLAEHAAAIGRVMAGEGRLWLGPFVAPTALPPGFTHTALVVPTSGSTGAAKAVALTREALLASQDATAALFAADGTAPETQGHGFWLPLLPPTHIAGVQIMARAHRTAQVLGLDEPALPAQMPDLSGHFDATAFMAAAEPALTRATELGLPAFTSLVPTQLTRIVTGATGPDARARALLRRFAAVLVGGAATRPEILARARAARIPVRTTYGSSETAGGCVYDRRALDGVTLAIEDPDHEGAGRLLVSSPSLATGYLRADSTAASDDTIAVVDGTRRLRTSDLARIDDGLLTIIGRADDVIITGGKKVVPQDVERILERTDMLRYMITGAVVVGVPDPEWGQRLEAVVTIAPWITPAEATPLVRMALAAAELPGHMIPKRAHVVEELPLLGIGKIDRSEAQRLAICRAEDPDAPSLVDRVPGPDHLSEPHQD